MKVRMRLCNNLNNRILELDVEKGTTVAQLLKLAKISEVNSTIVISNGKVLSKDTILDNDIELKIHPIIMGG